MVIVEGKPRGAFCIEAKRLDARHLLAVVRQHASDISSSGHVEERDPWVEGRDVGRVRSDTGRDPRIHDATERWSAAVPEVRPCLGAGAAPKFLECFESRLVDALQVN